VKVKYSFVRELSSIVEFECMSPLISYCLPCGGRDDFWPLILISFGLGRTYQGTYPG